MQIICALFERYSDIQLYYNMLQNRIGISHLVQGNPSAQIWHRSLQMERTQTAEYRFNYTGQQTFSIFEICWEWLVPSAQGPRYRLYGIGNAISTFQVPYFSKEACLDYDRIDYKELFRAQITNIKKCLCFPGKISFNRVPPSTPFCT